jgi:hypothetical protein
MLKSNKVKFIKALTVGALLANGSLGADQSNKKDTESSDHPAHQAKFVNTLAHIVDQGNHLRNGLRSVDQPIVVDIGSPSMNIIQNIALERLEQRNQQRQDVMRQPRTIDLSVKSLDAVRNFLKNARIHDVQVKLTLLNITEDQLNEILNDVNDEIEDLNWTYMTPTQVSTLEDPDEETTPTDAGDTLTDSDDEEDDEDETETPGYTAEGDWDNPLDRKGISNPRPRRSVARGRHPILFRDLVENHRPGVELVVPSKVVYLVPQKPQLDVNLPDHEENPSLGSWNMTLAKNSGDTQNGPNQAAPKGTQSHHLVNMFCRGRSAMVKAG